MTTEWKEIDATNAQVVFRCPECFDEDTAAAAGLDDVPHCCDCDSAMVLDRILAKEPDAPAPPEICPVFVRVKVHSDDYRKEVTIDGAQWLASASPDEIDGLAAEGWGYSQAADSVAIDSTDNPKVAEVLDYCQLAGVGFEVDVNQDEALDWLKANRPTVWEEISAAD